MKFDSFVMSKHHFKPKKIISYCKFEMLFSFQGFRSKFWKISIVFVW